MCPYSTFLSNKEKVCHHDISLLVHRVLCSTIHPQGLHGKRDRNLRSFHILYLRSLGGTTDINQSGMNPTGLRPRKAAKNASYDCSISRRCGAFLVIVDGENKKVIEVFGNSRVGRPEVEKPCKFVHIHPGLIGRADSAPLCALRLRPMRLVPAFSGSSYRIYSYSTFRS